MDVDHSNLPLIVLSFVDLGSFKNVEFEVGEICLSSYLGVLSPI